MITTRPRRVRAGRARRLRVIAAIAGVVVLLVVAAITVGVPRAARHDAAPSAATATDPGAARTPAARAMAAVVVRRYAYLDRATTAGAIDPGQNYGDLFMPPGLHAPRSLPLVVLVHGGGWTARYGAGTFTALARTLAARGLAVYNIEYRRLGSGGGWPTTFTDVAAALDHIPTLLATNSEVDPADAVLVGHSAGAQLAVWAGTRRPGAIEPGPDPRAAPDRGSAATPVWRPSRIVSLAGPLNMATAANTGDSRVVRILGGTPAQVPDRYRAVDPIENIDPTMPITVVHGTADTVVRPSQSTSYVDAVTRDRGRARLVLLPRATHSALVSSTSSTFPRVVDIIVSAARAVS